METGRSAALRIACCVACASKAEYPAEVWGRGFAPLKPASGFTTGPPNHPLRPPRVADAADLGEFVGGGEMGREKLMEDWLPYWSSSGTWERPEGRGCPLSGVPETPRSRLTPLPPPLATGEPPRYAGSKLEARRCRALSAGTFRGSFGTGGASWSMGLLRAGEGSRKVRSVMEPELEWRRNVGACCWLALPCDECEPLRAIRFVTV